MTAYVIKYEGPAATAVQAATMLADSEGVELRASQPPTRRDDSADTVVLALTVEGTTDAVLDAVALLRGQLPAGATFEIEGGAT